MSVALFVALAAAVAGCGTVVEGSPEAPARRSDIVLARDFERLQAIVPSHTTLAALLLSHGLSPLDAGRAVASLAGVFDVRRLRAGQPYRIDRLLDGRLRELEYEIDLGRRLLVRRTGDSRAGFAAEVATMPQRLERVTVEGAISRDTPTLTQAIEAAGERLDLALGLADILSGELDFSSELQPGDTFRVVVDRATRVDGVFVGYGAIHAAEYINAGRAVQAFRFTPPDGKPGYYDAEGRSLKRLFLKSPLKFEPRITSSFSRARRHPILNYTRAHNGVDYRAPAGAPVAAVANGVVTLAGWTNGGGRTVRLRHASGYESEYLHLSVITVRSGARVGQGELIGRVGATGLATGPHLHYGLRRNGVYLNPVREHQNMPPGEPVAEFHRALFVAERDQARLLLAQRSRATN